MAVPSFAAEARSSSTKATVARHSFRAQAKGTSTLETPAQAVLTGLDGRVLQEYDDITLVEISDHDKDALKQAGDRESVLVTLHDEFDKIFLNGRVLDARADRSSPPTGEKLDPPYASNEQGAWLVQFIGPIKDEWLAALKAAGIVPVQYVSMHAYIVGARESDIDAIAELPFIQWTSQMHRFLKPSVGSREAKTIELWIELARTEGTDDAVSLLEKLSDGRIEAAPWSETELRVQGVFPAEAIDVILAQPLVIGLAERPTIGLSDERAVLGLTNMVPSTGSPAPEAGKYKKWLSDLCPSCTALQTDGFYAGIADTGLDGGDRVASGTLSGEAGSTDLHRDELAGTRVAWGSSFENTTGDWSTCASLANCPDTTGSKHDVIGHGTLVAGIAAGDPLTTSGKDADGFFRGLGVAPSAGMVITKISSGKLGNGTTPVTDVTRDARTQTSPHAYWQNFSLNQYYNSVGSNTCDNRYDGAYSLLSRDFDSAVRDADPTAANNQQLTITTSSGNTHQQITGSGWNPATCAVDRTLTLPPATAKNVIAVGGAENVRPDPWLCFGTRADSYMNLAMDAKHGTRVTGWYKPDLIAVTTSITSLLSNDKAVTGGFCGPYSGTDPSVPSPYLPSSGTSFAAPAGLGAAVLASRRFNSDPSAATPALVKAMLIAGAKSMLGGKDRASLRLWKQTSSSSYYPGNRVLPTTPNNHYYEITAVGSANFGQTGSTEPVWPTNGTTVQDGSGSTAITWLDKGLEVSTLDIKGFPNSQQGFGRISLQDVLSDFPTRAYINQTQTLSAGGSWTHEYVVHDSALPVRIALVWTDLPKMWDGSGVLSPNPPLVNDLNLSVEVKVSGSCVGRYVGNVLGTTEESTYYQPCTGGTHDSLNNAEIARFFATAGRGDTTFTVKVASAAGSSQDFALVVWNAYDSAASAPPPTPANFAATASSTSQVNLTWSASSGATSYEVQRSAGVSDPYATIASPTITSHSDTGRSSMTTYLYRLRAKNATGVSDWVVDPATTVIFTDPTLTAGSTPIKVVHFTELRQAVGAMRTAAGLAAYSWTDSLVAGTTVVRAVHVSELRTALNQARSALALSMISFTDATLTSGVTSVKAVHVQELRQGAQ